MTRIFYSLLFLLFVTSSAFAQEFETTRYDINATVNTDAHSLTAKARLKLINLSGRDLLDKILLAGPDGKPKLSFFLNSRAKVSEFKLNNAVATSTSREDRSGVQVVSTDITSTIANLREFDVEFTYSIPLLGKVEGSTQSSDGSRSGLLISALEAFALPGSFWIPVKNAPYSQHSADTAPYSLTITAPAGLKVVSTGARKADGEFENIYAGQPFFIVGDYDVYTAGNDSVTNADKVEVYAPRGLDEAGRQQAQRTATEAARVIDFYAKYFGGLVGGTFRIASSQARERDSAITGELISRGLNYAAPGVLLVSDSVFRRNALDLSTIELIASAAARQWIDGRVLLRGRGAGFLRDALPVYLSAQYLGERFGNAQREAAYERYRRAYAPVARGGDAPLIALSPLERGYTTSMYNKGALVWRLFEQRIGKQNFEALLRGIFDRQRVDVVSLTDWRTPLCGATRCGSLKSILLGLAQQPAGKQAVNELFANWIEEVVLPDIAVGQPQAGANGIESTVTNFGNGDLTVDVIATTTTGEKLRQSVLVKAGEFPTVNFPAGTQIATIEIDSERVYLQKDYTNDTFPRRPAQADLYGQAMLHLSNFQMLKNTPPESLTEAQRKLSPTQELSNAEAKAREALKAEPDSPTFLALLGRVSLGAKKNDEATAAFNAALKTEPVPIQAYGWSLLGLGELALAQNNFAEASKRFREAAATDLDLVTILAAREGALNAERGMNAVKLTDEVKGFLQKFDAAILQGSSEALNALVEQGTLQRFGTRLIVTQPSLWTSEALRTEVWDANRIAVDVRVKTRTKVDNKEYSGSALYVLSKSGGKLLLSEVPIFDVK